ELARRRLDDGARLGDTGQGHTAEQDHRRDRLGDLIDVRLAHECAAARPDLHMDEPARLEYAKCVAHGDPRDAEALRKLPLRLEPIAGFEVPVEDLPLDLGDDLARRARLPDRSERDTAHAVAAAFCLQADASSRYTTLSWPCCLQRRV